MLVPVLFAALLLAAAGLIAYMATHGQGDFVKALEHEVAKIRDQADHGWSTPRILRHHHKFCTCQVEYLRGRAHHPV